MTSIATSHFSSGSISTAQTVISGSKTFIGAVKDEWQLFSDCASDYTIGSPIGFGASSIVYAATYQPHNRSGTSPTIPPPISCALKVLDLDTLAPRSLALLQKETTLMSLSKHPNVLRVRGSWMEGHKLYIALRLMNKGSAADVMRYGWPGGMEEEVVKCILRQTLQGLNYLHINGFIHRDVKAANLLIDDDGTVLLGDLGVAADLTEDSSHLFPPKQPKSSQSSPQSHTINGGGVNASATLNDAASRPRMGKRKSFVGTPCWMSPELIQGRQYDSSADIWSFGITALELTQGRPPRSRDTPQRVLLRTIQDDPPTLDRDNGTHRYSRAFKEIVDSCLNKDPSKRPTAEELLQTPFFKAAKKKSYLVGAILKDLPPLTQRQERRVAGQIQTLQSVDSWDFATTLNSATTSVYRRHILEDMEVSENVKAPERTDGVFEMENETLRDDDKQGAGQHGKGVSWDEGPPVVFEDDTSEAGRVSPPRPDLDDLETSNGSNQSSPSSGTSDSSAPSSYVDSTLKPPEGPSHIPNITTALSIPESHSKVSPRLFAASSVSSSSSASVLSSASSSKQNLWSKIKSNVRRQGSRSRVSGKERTMPPANSHEKSDIADKTSGAGEISAVKANNQTIHIFGSMQGK